MWNCSFWFALWCWSECLTVCSTATSCSSRSLRKATPLRQRWIAWFMWQAHDVCKHPLIESELPWSCSALCNKNDSIQKLCAETTTKPTRNNNKAPSAEPETRSTFLPNYHLRSSYICRAEHCLSKGCCPTLTLRCCCWRRNSNKTTHHWISWNDWWSISFKYCVGTLSIRFRNLWKKYQKYIQVYEDISKISKLNTEYQAAAGPRQGQFTTGRASLQPDGRVYNRKKK